MKKPVLAGVIVVAVILGIIAYSTMQSFTSNRVEVCMQFNGVTNCKIARGATQEDAVRTATSERLRRNRQRRYRHHGLPACRTDQTHCFEVRFKPLSNQVKLVRERARILEERRFWCEKYCSLLAC